MKKIATLLAVVAMSAGILTATATSASAAGGPVKHDPACESLGYKTLVSNVSLRKDGFGNKIGEIRTLKKSAKSSQWCTYLKKTDNTVGNANKVRLKVTVLTKSGSKYVNKSASLTETVKYYSSSYTYTSLHGQSAVKKKATLDLDGGMKSATNSTWWDTGLLLIG